MCVIPYYFVTMVVCIVGRLVFNPRFVMVCGFVPMIVVYPVLLKVVCFLSLGQCLCIASLRSGCDGCLFHAVVFSAFMIYVPYFAMLSMCVLYVSNYRTTPNYGTGRFQMSCTRQQLT